MMRRLTALALGALLAGAPLAAQQPADSVFARRSPALVHYGKWAVLAAAVGMGLKAGSAHRGADRAYHRLQQYCVENDFNCAQRPDGRYVDPVAEGYYQSAVQGDRHARGWLLGGEAALLGAAGLFVWELTRPKGPTENIPFEPRVSVVGPRTQLGVAFRF